MSAFSIASTVMGTGRKIVFVLGAGASRGAGATASVQHGSSINIPTQNTFWSTFLRLCKSSDRRKKIQSFLFKYFTSYDRVPARLSNMERNELLASIDVEEVFTFISERVLAPATSAQMRTHVNEIWEALNIEIGNVFRRFEPNQSTRRTYKRFAKKHILARDSVISFNYDTVFERSIGSSLAWGYHCVDNTTHKLSVYKPHGSINWEIVGGKIVVSAQRPARPVVVAPTHLKFVGANGSHAPTVAGYLNSTHQLFDIWSEMEIELKMAKALVFIGYSFPSADLYFSSLLRTVVNTGSNKPTIVLVNPDSAEISRRIKERFSVITKNYFDLSQFTDIPRRAILE